MAARCAVASRAAKFRANLHRRAGRSRFANACKRLIRFTNLCIAAMRYLRIRRQPHGGTGCLAPGESDPRAP